MFCYTTSMLKQLGFISIISMWIGTFLLIRHHLPDLGKTISQHASKSARYHILYGILEIIVVSLFSLFIFGWFIPAFHLGPAYAVAAIMGFVGTVIAAFIPDREGWQAKVHGIGAYGMAMTLIVMDLLLLTSPHVHLLTRIFLYISLAYMISGTIIAITYPWLYRRNALRLQIIYFLAYQIPILTAVYF